MPIGRIILKSISDSRKVSELKTDGARLLYTWLLTHLDINGCYSGDPEVVRGKVFTRLRKSTKTIEDYLVDLEQNSLLVRYSVNGDIFLNVPDFVEKQPSLNPDRERATGIPLPTPDLLQTNSSLTPCKDKIREDKIREDKISKEKDIPFDEITDFYNKACEKLPQVQTLSDKRMTAIKVRYEKYGLEKLKELFNKAGDSKFLNGGNKSNWTATFDWLLNENNMIKVLEGNYDTKSKPDWRTT